jgi:chromosomal replication initiator protein
MAGRTLCNTYLRKTIKRELGEDAKLEYRILVDSSAGSKSSPKTIDVPNYREGVYGTNEVSMPAVFSSPMVKNPFVIPGLKKYMLIHN